MLTSTEGLIASLFLANLLFVSLITRNTLKIWRKESGSTKLLIINILGVLMYASFTFNVILNGLLWTTFDTISTLLIVFGIIMVKGNTKIIPGIIKGIPQFFLAITILMVGASGISLIMVLVFHALTIPRLFEVWLLWKKDKKNSDKKWILISETINETTWMFVTVSYVIMEL